MANFREPKIIKPPPDLDDEIKVDSQEQMFQDIETKIVNGETHECLAKKPGDDERANISEGNGIAIYPQSQINSMSLATLFCIVLAIHMLIIRMASLYGMIFFWSLLAALSFVTLVVWRDEQTKREKSWETDFKLLSNQSTRFLSSSGETARWLNSIITLFWNSTLPSLEPKVREAINLSLTSSPLPFPFGYLKCSDIKLNDATPKILHVSSSNVGKDEELYPKFFEWETDSSEWNSEILDECSRENQEARFKQWFPNFAKFVHNGDKPVHLFPAVQNCHPPAISLDMDILLDTVSSKAKLTGYLKMIPFEVSTTLHCLKAKASIRVYLEFNRHLSFPHIARVSAAFLEQPDFTFKLQMFHHIELHKLPYLRFMLHKHFAKYIAQRAMFPDWFEILSYATPVCPFRHHLPGAVAEQLSGDVLYEKTEPFKAAVGILIIDVKMMPKSLSPLPDNVTSQRSPPLTNDTIISGVQNLEFWITFHLSSLKTYEQIDSSSHQLINSCCDKKMAFLIQNSECDNLRIEAWTRRGPRTVKVRHIVLKGKELYQESKAAYLGHNRIEIAIPQLNCNVYINANYMSLQQNPTFATNSKANLSQDVSLQSAQKRSIHDRRHQSKLQKSVDNRIADSTPSQKPSISLPNPTCNNNLIFGGVLLVRIRNLALHVNSYPNDLQSHPKYSDSFNKKLGIYIVVSINGKPFQISPSHSITCREVISVPVVHEFELILYPPVNPLNNRDIEFTVDVLLSDNPIKEKHTFIGFCTFTFKLPSHRADGEGQAAASSTSTKALALNILQPTRNKSKTLQQNNDFQLGAEHSGQVQADLCFRPVNGLEEVTTCLYDLAFDRHQEGYFKRVINDDVGSSNIAPNDFYEVTICGACDVKLPNPNSLGDLFVKVKLNSRTIHSTKVKPSTTEPIWNESFRLPHLNEFDRLIIELWDYNFVSRSIFVGHLSLTNEDLLLNSVQPSNEKISVIVGNTGHQQSETIPNTLWFPLQEFNGQLELLIVGLRLNFQNEPLSKLNNRGSIQPYLGSRSCVSKTDQLSLYMPTLSPTPSISNDLHLNSPFIQSPTTRKQCENSSSVAAARRSGFSRAQTEMSNAVPGGQEIIRFGSNENLPIFSNINYQIPHNDKHYSFSTENLTFCNNERNEIQGYEQPSLGRRSEMLEIALLTSNSATTNARVSLSVTLLEVRGNLSALLRRPTIILSSGSENLKSNFYISIKVSKKTSPKSLQVFSTTLAKSRPLPIVEFPLQHQTRSTSVPVNLSFQLQDVRMDGGIKIVVQPLEVNGVFNPSSVARPVQSSPTNPESKVAVTAKPIPPTIEWTCDVRELLSGGTEEMELSNGSQNMWQPGGAPSPEIHRRVRFFVCSPDISFVFRVSPQMAQSQHKVQNAISLNRVGGSLKAKKGTIDSTELFCDPQI